MPLNSEYLRESGPAKAPSHQAVQGIQTKWVWRFSEVTEGRHEASAEIRLSVAAGPGVSVLPLMENPAKLIFKKFFPASFQESFNIFFNSFLNFNLYFSSYYPFLLFCLGFFLS